MISDTLTFVFDGNATEFDFPAPKNAYTSYQFAKKITLSVLQFDVQHSGGQNNETLYLDTGDIANCFNSKYRDGSVLLSTEYPRNPIVYKLDKLPENYKFKFRTLNGGATTRTNAVAVIRLEYFDEVQDISPAFMKRF